MANVAYTQYYVYAMLLLKTNLREDFIIKITLNKYLLC